jgi:hypothetical protein
MDNQQNLPLEHAGRLQNQAAQSIRSTDAIARFFGQQTRLQRPIKSSKPAGSAGGTTARSSPASTSRCRRSSSK